MITHIVSDWLFSPCCVEHQDEFIFERVAVAYSRDYNEVGRAQIKCKWLSLSQRGGRTCSNLSAIITTVEFQNNRTSEQNCLSYPRNGTGWHLSLLKHGIQEGQNCVQALNASKLMKSYQAYRNFPCFRTLSKLSHPKIRANKCNHPYKMKRLLQCCGWVAATMQQLDMYATTGGDKVAN